MTFAPTTARRVVTDANGSVEEVVALAALDAAHREARRLRDSVNNTDPALAFFFGQVAYLLSRCRAGHAPERRDFLGLALVGQRAFGGRRK